MSRFTVKAWFLGVPEGWGGTRSRLWELPTRSIFGCWRSRRRFRVPEQLSSVSWLSLSHPSWATTKERTAWRFGA